MSGISCHAADKYIDRLIAKGYTVAIAEQLDEPGKGLVRREIVRFVSPSTTLSDAIFNEREARFFAAAFTHDNRFGLALVDVTTGEFLASEYPTHQALIAALARSTPKELLVMKSHAKLFRDSGIRLILKETWFFNEQMADEALCKHFCIASLDAFGFKEEKSAIAAAGAAFFYLQSELSFSLKEIKKLGKIQTDDLLEIDPTTSRHLDLFPTLFSHIDRTATAMGMRLLKRWLASPLRKKDTILRRQQAVHALIPAHQLLYNHLKEVRDIAPLISRIRYETAHPRDLSALGITLQALPRIKENIRTINNDYMRDLNANIKDFDTLASRLECALNDTLPLRLSDGGVIRSGYSWELDEWRNTQLRAVPQ